MSGASQPSFAALGGDVEVSFEFFPPKGEAGEAALFEAADALAPYRPRFFSVTYGAGGSTRDRSLALVERLEQATGIPVAAHLTCVAADKQEIADVASAIWAAGSRHIVALRGDQPGGGKFEAHPQGYAGAAELIEGLAGIHPFEISVAAYPETHPDAQSPDHDLDNLKRKVDAGATRALTQFFFSPDLFFRFRDRCAAAGINAEIVPGIMPIGSVAAVRRMSGLCGTEIPAWMDAMLEGLDGQPATRELVAASIAADLTAKLYEGGVRQFHIYTLNKAPQAAALCHLLGLRPHAKEAA